MFFLKICYSCERGNATANLSMCFGDLQRIYISKSVDGMLHITRSTFLWNNCHGMFCSQSILAKMELPTLQYFHNFQCEYLWCRIWILSLLSQIPGGWHNDMLEYNVQSLKNMNWHLCIFVIWHLSKWKGKYFLSNFNWNMYTINQ